MYTDRLRELVALANEIAVRGTHKGWLRPRPFGFSLMQWVRPVSIRPAHLLIALTTGPKGVGYHALLACGVDLDELTRCAASTLPSFASGLIDSETKLPLHRASKIVVAQAGHEQRLAQDSHIGTEHLLLALIRKSDRGTRAVLRRWHADYRVASEWLAQNRRRAYEAQG